VAKTERAERLTDLQKETRRAMGRGFLPEVSGEKTYRRRGSMVGVSGEVAKVIVELLGPLVSESKFRAELSPGRPTYLKIRAVVKEVARFYVGQIPGDLRDTTVPGDLRPKPVAEQLDLDRGSPALFEAAKRYEAELGAKREEVLTSTEKLLADLEATFADFELRTEGLRAKIHDAPDLPEIARGS